MAEPALLQPALQENALIDYLARIGKRPAGRLAAHIQLSRLARMHTRDNYIDLAADMLTTALRGRDGQLFRLHNNDLLFIATDVPLAVLDRAVDRLRSLFNEDPIFAPAAPPFCAWYRLAQDYNALAGMAEDWLREAEQAQADYARKDPTAGLSPIQPDLLARVEQTLKTTDLTNLARRQMICTLVKDQAPQPLFEEIYVSIVELQALVTPGVNWLANPWLFQYITQTLDKRMMAMLTKRGPPAGMPFSINLNVASVLSPEFRRFDEVVSPQVRGRLVIELNKLDVFSDIGAFGFARDYLRDRGYRLCLDGLSHQTLPYYNRAKLGFDLVKLFWQPDGIEDLLPDMIPAVREAILEAGQARTILCRCENATAIEVGQQLGIVMFQGRYVDRLSTNAVKAGVGNPTPPPHNS